MIFVQYEKRTARRLYNNDEDPWSAAYYAPMYEEMNDVERILDSTAPECCGFLPYTDNIYVGTTYLTDPVTGDEFIPNNASPFPGGKYNGSDPENPFIRPYILEEIIRGDGQYVFFYGKDTETYDWKCRMGVDEIETRQCW